MYGKIITVLLTMITLFLTYLSWLPIIFETTTMLCSDYDEFCINLQENSIETSYELTNNTKFTLSLEENKVTCNINNHGIILEEDCSLEIKEILSNANTKKIKMSINAFELSNFKISAKWNIISSISLVFKNLIHDLILKPIIYPLLVFIFGLLSIKPPF